MSSLAAMGLGVYDLIPDFQERCPLCQGAGCAVRHGLYFRQAADEGGAVYGRFPVPRFLCREKGPRKPESRTFSVLPASLVPRRRFSLPLMLWLLSLVLEGGKTVRQALDRLAESCQGQSGGPLCPEEAAVHRLIDLFSRGFERLQSFPVPGAELGGVQGRRPQALALLRMLSPPCRGSPSSLPLGFHRHHFPNLLLDLRTG